MSNVTEVSGEVGEKVLVLKFRGGPADGVYRLARGSAPLAVIVERNGVRTPYRLGVEDEPQTRDVHGYDPQTKQATRKRIVEAYYQIYVPEEVSARA